MDGWMNVHFDPCSNLKGLSVLLRFLKADFAMSPVLKMGVEKVDRNFFATANVNDKKYQSKDLHHLFWNDNDIPIS